MTTLRCVLPLLLASLASTPLWSADAPTAEEWTPVEQALNEDAPDAPTKLSALVNAYPRWSDGHRTLAQLLLRQGRTDAALTEANQALALAPTDASSAAVAVQAYGALGRPADAYAIADRFVGEKDPQGWVNFRAAEVALSVGDRAKADLHLSLANGRAKKNPPAEFAYLDARISAAAGDLDRAELSLNRAVGGNPRLWDAWYELGVVQLRQADAKTASTRREYLEKSAASFTKVTAIHSKDAHAWLGLGRAQLTLAQYLTMDRADEGRALAAKAATSLKNAIEINAELRDAHLNLGVALLMSDDHEGAITHLLKARDLGSTSRTLGFNLMLAYQKAGRTAEFEAEARNVQAVSTAEKLTAGIGFFRAGNHALAAELLTSALPDLGEDRERVASTYRFIGHAHAALADALRTKPGSDPAAIEAALDRARDAYRKAGNLHDFPAQRFFMAQETTRSPDAGYAAGWQHIAWNGYGSLDGWSAVVGNYGGAVTGGQGIAGMWQRNPVHVVVWGVLAFLPLLLGVIGFLRPKRVEEDDHREQDRRPISEPIVRSTTRPPASKPAPAPAPKASSTNNRAPVTKAPQAPVKQRTPAPPATIPSAKPVPAAKHPTPRPKVRSPIETEPSMTPLGNIIPTEEPRARKPETDASLRPAKAQQKQVRTSGEFAALERRSPRPEDGKKP